MNKTMERAIELLNDQGYTIEDVYNQVISRISDPDRMFNIYCAIECDVSDRQSISIVQDYVERFVSELIVKDIVNFNPDHDYMDCISDFVDDNISKFNDLNSELEYYGDKQLREWKDEEDELNRYYWSTRI